jgi:uncharacterized protein YdeI (YjbR/CyaY-like superfamily)
MLEAQLFTTARQWRTWLERNHTKKSEIWIKFAKKGSGKKSITYDQALDEALCFGWIDTLVKRFDDDYYIQRFVPRKTTSRWSTINLDKFDRLEAEGRMTDAGRAARPGSVKPPPPRYAANDPVPDFVARELSLHPVARDFFHSLAPGYRRNYIRWITEAKREETRTRRLAEAVKKLEAGIKPAM